jgi:hypothetical protein
MKKNYFLAVLFSFAMISLSAQFSDDMESYVDGSPISGAHWTDWGCGGGPGCAIMSSSAEAQGGLLSGLIPDDTTTDAVLDLGNKIFGTWGLSFWMYVESDQNGYWNLQGNVPIGAGEWIIGDVFFNQDNANPGVGLVDNSALGPVNFDFPHDTWFRVVMNWDISAGISAATWGWWVDGVWVLPDGTPFTDGAATVPTSLGGFDFFSIDGNCLYYMDSFEYIEGYIDPQTSGVEDLNEKGFSAYPNPVTDILNLRANEEISSVSVSNILGQVIYSANVDSMNSTIDMSSYSSGTYFVTVQIGNTQGTVKVLR